VGRPWISSHDGATPAAPGIHLAAATTEIPDLVDVDFRLQSKPPDQVKTKDLHASPTPKVILQAENWNLAAKASSYPPPKTWDPRKPRLGCRTMRAAKYPGRNGPTLVQPFAAFSIAKTFPLHPATAHASRSTANDEFLLKASAGFCAPFAGANHSACARGHSCRVSAGYKCGEQNPPRAISAVHH